MEEKQKKLFMICMGMLLVLVLIGGGTYAWLTLSLKGTKMNVLKAGNLSLVLDDINSIGIDQEKAVPTLDAVGETFDPYHFTLENLSEIVSNYTIYLDDVDLEDGEVRMEDKYLRYSLVKDKEKRKDALSTLGENPNRVLDSGTIEGGKKITYDLRLWMDIASGNEAMNKVFRSKIRIVATQNEEKDCYVFNKETKEITDYLCYEGNIGGFAENSQVIIPDTIDGVTVEKIGARAFQGNKLTSVTIPEGVTTIGDYAFLSNELSNIRLPSSITSIGPAAFNDNKLSDSEAFIYKRNSDGTIDTTTVVSYGGAKRTSVVVPIGVKVLEIASMSYNSITSVTLPEGLTKIGAHCFRGYSSLSTVTIPSTVKTIGQSAFPKTATTNSNLTKIVNKPRKSFDWKSITEGNGDAVFISGAVSHTNGNITVTIPSGNSNIVSVYRYHASTCLTGEESGCVEIGLQSTYTAGTIVKYRVNASEVKYFHVMFDNDSNNTLTMQQRENTVEKTAWYSNSNDNTKGPLTVLPLLESATAGWTNVNNQTYTMGTTLFKENSFTGCTYGGTEQEISCTVNTYTLASRTKKARMITAQEAKSLGCKYGKHQTCPAWMNNYLSKSTSYGGTVNGGDSGYWAMSVFSPDVAYALYMHYNGCVYSNQTTGTTYGARAVVVIDK